MAKFFVGQRVRIVRSSKKFMIGRQATIWKADHHDNHIQHGPGFYFYLDVDGLGRKHNTTPIAYRAEDLEPLLGRHTPCESEFKESLDRLLERVEA